MYHLVSNATKPQYSFLQSLFTFTDLRYPALLYAVIFHGMSLFWSYWVEFSLPHLKNGEREFPGYCDDVAHAAYDYRREAVPSVPRRSMTLHALAC